MMHPSHVRRLAERARDRSFGAEFRAYDKREARATKRARRRDRGWFVPDPDAAEHRAMLAEITSSDVVLRAAKSRARNR